MKKLFAIILTLILTASMLSLVACDPNNTDGPNTPKGTITVAMPDGAPVLAVYNLLKNVKTLDGYQMEYKILSGAANIGTSVLTGEADVAVMPTNVAAKLFNNGADIKLMSVNIFGVLYMVGKTPLINGLEDLKGKVLLNIGRGGSPDITTKLILDKNNIPYEESETAIEGKVALRYCADASEVIALLKTDKADYGVMGEPAVTNAVKALSASIVMDLQSVWNDSVGENSFTQAGVVLGKSVYNDKNFVNALYAALNENLDYIYTDAQNVKQTLIDNGSALKVDFTTEVLNRCNLKNQKAADIQSKLEAYFTEVMAYDKTFIGGKIPNADLYYKFD